MAAPAQLAMLRRLAAEPRAVIVQLQPPRLLDRATVRRRIYIEADAPGDPRGRLKEAPYAVCGSPHRMGRSDRPSSLPSLPAGTIASGRGPAVPAAGSCRHRAGSVLLWSGPTNGRRRRSTSICRWTFVRSCPRR